MSSYGYSEILFDMKYSDSIATAISVADTILTQEKDPRLNVNKLTYLANTDDNLIRSFLELDIGDLIRVVDPLSSFDGYYYIHAVDILIQQGGLIYFTWSLIDALSLSYDYWVLGTSVLGTDTDLGF